METTSENGSDPQWKPNAFSCMVCGAAFSGGEKIKQRDKAVSVELPGNVINDPVYSEYVRDLVANELVGRKVCIHGNQFTVNASRMECATLFILLETKKPGNAQWAASLTELLCLLASITPKS
jgi:hypothetical protein